MYTESNFEDLSNINSKRISYAKKIKIDPHLKNKIHELDSRN